MEWLFNKIILVLVLLVFLVGGAFYIYHLPELKPIVIKTEAGVEHVFNVEKVDTSKIQVRALTFTSSLPLDEGVLFDFDFRSIKFFWMKNIYIPLDIIFIDEDGVIARIEKNVEPASFIRDNYFYIKDFISRYVSEPINKVIPSRRVFDDSKISKEEAKDIEESMKAKLGEKISSQVPVEYVLEINGGLTDKLGIAVGDQVIHQGLSNE